MSRKVNVSTKAAPTVKKESGMGTPSGSQKGGVRTISSFKKNPSMNQDKKAAAKKADMGIGSKNKSSSTTEKGSA